MDAVEAAASGHPGNPDGLTHVAYGLWTRFLKHAILRDNPGKEELVAEFVPAGKANEVSEGALRAFDVGGTAVAVANVAGTFHAFGDTCTHQQCSLADGDLEGTTVTCPCHGSQFDVTTGSVLNPPAEEPVPSYGVRLEGDELQIEM